MIALATEPTDTHQIKALATDWVRPFYFPTFADALIYVTLEVGERIVRMRERYTRETSGFVQYGAIEDDDWVIIESSNTNELAEKLDELTTAIQEVGVNLSHDLTTLRETIEELTPPPSGTPFTGEGFGA